MKIVILNDTHAGVRNASDVFIEYQRKFYEELLFPYMNENGIKNIIHLGDYYETRKFINFKALSENRKHFLDHLRTYGIHMDIIPGNHDVVYKNTNDLCSLKELMGHYYNEVTIHMEPVVKNYDGLNVALLPWINVENYHRSMEFIQKCDAPILGGHLELNGFEMMRGVKNTHGLEANLFSRFEMVLSGHFHTKSNQGNVTYLGSQMEFTWADADDPKYFHVLDTETRELTAVLNPFRMFEKIVYKNHESCYNNNLAGKFVKVIVLEKSDPFLFDKFIDQINQQNPIELKIAESFSEFEGAAVEDDKIMVETTTDLLNSYIDSVDTDLDKDKMKSIMNELFIVATNKEIV